MAPPACPTAWRGLGVKIPLESIDEGIHVAHGAITQGRHRAMGHAPVRFNLGPPDAAMPDAHAIHVEWFGNDDMIDARRGKPSALRQVVNAAVTAGLFIDG